VDVKADESQNKVQYGDIFFTVSSETPNEVGMASVLLENVDELYLNSFCFGFRLYDFNTLLPEFGSYYLRSDVFRSEIYKLSQGATRFNLSKNSLMKLDILLPSLAEQTAIANILSAADSEITLAKQKLARLKEQKKGLMQVLLTGKKRVKI
jgi:type I restriction enzyme S subunit